MDSPFRQASSSHSRSGPAPMLVPMLVVVPVYGQREKRRRWKTNDLRKDLTPTQSGSCALAVWSRPRKRGRRSGGNGMQRWAGQCTGPTPSACCCPQTRKPRASRPASLPRRRHERSGPPEFVPRDRCPDPTPSGCGPWTLRPPAFLPASSPRQSSDRSSVVRIAYTKPGPISVSLVLAPLDPATELGFADGGETTVFVGAEVR